MKGVQCYELFGGIALKYHAFSFHHMELLRKPGLPDLLTRWTRNICAIDPPQAMASLRILSSVLQFFCYSMLYTRKVQQFFYSCLLVTCNIHLLFMPSLSICNSAFFCCHMYSRYEPLVVRLNPLGKPCRRQVLR